jgi:hypothetical protein
MEVIGISVKQVVIGIEFTPRELAQLRWFLDESSIGFNGENEFEKTATEYVTDELYPVLVDLLKELKNAPG